MFPCFSHKPYTSGLSSWRQSIGRAESIIGRSTMLIGQGSKHWCLGNARLAVGRFYNIINREPYLLSQESLDKAFSQIFIDLATNFISIVNTSGQSRKTTQWMHLKTEQLILLRYSIKKCNADFHMLPYIYQTLNALPGFY